MIDQNILLNDFEETAKRLARRGVERSTLEELQRHLENRRSMLHAIEEDRARLNAASDEVGRLMREGKKSEAEAVRASVPDIKERIAGAEPLLREVEAKIDHMIMRIPNIPLDSCPEGKDDGSNVVLRTEGYDPARFAGRTYRPHWEVATALGIYDAERASKISGSMFSLMRREGAALLRALVRFGIELNQDRYEEIAPPHFVRTETFTATGHLPKFEADAYRLRDDELWVIPTGEVPLMGLHRDEILPEEELPKRYMAYTVCFRREAGSAGKDTRGMQRLHEFHKVELVKLCTPEQIDQEFQSMLADAERPLKMLGLPYRVVDLCCGDLTFSSARIFDLEVFAPGVGRWLEVSSVGIFTDFQARRGNIRFRRGKEKARFVHALNGSAMATPRVWAAVIEHGQQPDGSVRIPEPLVPYMGKEFIKPR